MPGQGSSRQEVNIDTMFKRWRILIPMTRFDTDPILGFNYTGARKMERRTGHARGHRTRKGSVRMSTGERWQRYWAGFSLLSQLTYPHRSTSCAKPRRGVRDRLLRYIPRNYLRIQCGCTSDPQQSSILCLICLTFCVPILIASANRVKTSFNQSTVIDWKYVKRGRGAKKCKI